MRPTSLVANGSSSVTRSRVDASPKDCTEAPTEPGQPLHLFEWFEDISAADVSVVGGKAASLGEMYGTLVERGVRIPKGFATTVESYRIFLEAEVTENGWDTVGEDLRAYAPALTQAETLREVIEAIFETADVKDHLDLHSRTALARALILSTPVPSVVVQAIREGYRDLSRQYS